ncbi:MAG TPA: glycosyltransferase [Vicinamibacterales bacterium]
MSHRLRVLHVGKYYPPARGGIERVTQLLCEAERAHVDSQVLVANTAARTVHEMRNGVPVTRIASFGAIGSVGVCPGFPAALARVRRDVTVIHEPNPVALVSDWVTAQSGPLVVWFHSEVVRPQWKYRFLYRPFLLRALRRADAIVISSPPMLEHAPELQRFREKCRVVPYGIDLGRLEATRTVLERARAIRASHRGPIVLFVGRLVPYKGVDVLLRAMATVDATAIVIGDGPLGGRLRTEAAALGLGSRVLFVGAASDEDLVAHLHACDVFVLPSVTHAEAFGVVQLEAMACGKPVVSTNVRSGVPWVNRHGVTGLVVEPGDSMALADALRTLLADDAMRRTMGAAGRDRVRREFTLERMALQTTRIYCELVQAASHADARVAAS